MDYGVEDFITENRETLLFVAENYEPFTDISSEWDDKVIEMCHMANKALIVSKFKRAFPFIKFFRDKEHRAGVDKQQNILVGFDIDDTPDWIQFVTSIAHEVAHCVLQHVFIDPNTLPKENVLQKEKEAWVTAKMILKQIDMPFSSENMDIAVKSHEEEGMGFYDIMKLERMGAISKRKMLKILTNQQD